MKITLTNGDNPPTLVELYKELLSAGFAIISGSSYPDEIHISRSIVERIFLINKKPSPGQTRLLLPKNTCAQSVDFNSLQDFIIDVCEMYFNSIETSESNRVGPPGLKIPKGFMEMHLNTFVGLAPLPEVNSVIIEVDERGKLILFSDRLISLIIRLSEAIVASKYIYDTYDNEEDIDETDNKKLDILLINGWDSLLETFMGISVRNMRLMRMSLPKRYEKEDLTLYLNDEEKRLSTAIAKTAMLFILGHEYAHIISGKKNIDFGECCVEHEMDKISLAMLLINPFIDTCEIYNRLEIIDAAITLCMGTGYFLDMYYGTKDYEHPDFMSRKGNIESIIGALLSPDDIEILLHSKLWFFIYCLKSIEMFTISQLQANNYVRGLFSSRGLEDYVLYGRGLFTRGHGDIFK